MRSHLVRAAAAVLTGALLLVSAACTQSIGGTASAGGGASATAGTGAPPVTETSASSDTGVPGIGDSALCDQFCDRTDELVNQQPCGTGGTDPSVCGDWAAKAATLAKDITAAPQYGSLSSSDKDSITELAKNTAAYSSGNCAAAKSGSTQELNCDATVFGIVADLTLLKLTLQLS